jgi:plastocyanin
MSREARSRVLLGAGIPLAAFAFLALLIFAFSRILLAVPESLAPWIALLFAVNVLVGCALAATIRGTRGFAFLITTLVLTMVGGGIAGAVVGQREIHSLVEEEAAPEAPPPPGEQPLPPPPEGAPPEGAVPIAAQGIAFDTAELSLPAEGPVTIAFDNRDPDIPHNVAIYTESGGDPIFQGEVITGPAQVEYTFEPPEPGTYYFQCDIHPPQMNGTVTVG